MTEQELENNPYLKFKNLKVYFAEPGIIQCTILPSETKRYYFIHASNSTNREYLDHAIKNKKLKKSGKWLVFAKTGKALDDLWLKVCQSLNDNKLGVRAKVSTMAENWRASNPEYGVICIYTYSSEDIEDCKRIRQELRDIGVTWKISYKLDQDVGRYAVQGEKKLSVFYE